ncbi:hypothetical protein HFP43_00770 [Streptomyces sp. SJ1-7]|nr:hypothetical protein [Streptomyces sp. SJ1-7]
MGEDRAEAGCARLARAAPAGSPLRAGLLTVINQLHDHDLLVARSGEAAESEKAEVPKGAAGQWLGLSPAGPPLRPTRLPAAGRGSSPHIRTARRPAPPRGR